LLVTLGAVIDNVVSLYQYENSPDPVKAGVTSSGVVSGLGERTMLYAIALAAVVRVARLMGARGGARR
jgi:hypothetical protein